jgi:hypothetical protein
MSETTPGVARYQPDNWRGRWPGATVYQGRHRERDSLPAFRQQQTGVVGDLVNVDEAPLSIGERLARLESVAHTHDDEPYPADSVLLPNNPLSSAEWDG